MTKKVPKNKTIDVFNRLISSIKVRIAIYVISHSKKTKIHLYRRKFSAECFMLYLFYAFRNLYIYFNVKIKCFFSCYFCFKDVNFILYIINN